MQSGSRNRRFALRSPGELLFDILNYTVLALVGVAMLYPLYNVLVLSLSPRLAAASLEPIFFVKRPTLEAYRQVLANDIIYIGYANTLFRTAFGTAGSVFLCYTVAFPLARKNLPFRTPVTLLLVFTMFFNGGLIPTYLLIRSLGLLNTRLVYIAPVLYNVWWILIMRNYIMTIPPSVEEAAVVDGASPPQILVRVMIPMSMPIVATITLWAAVFHWNSWFDSLIYVTDTNKQVMQMVLRRIVLMQQMQEMYEGGLDMVGGAEDSVTGETIRAATIIVAIGPIIAAYPFLQKHFVKGVMVGSLKG